MQPISKINIVTKFIKEQDTSSALELINHARLNDLNDSEIAELAQGLAKSGEIIKNKDGSSYWDIPSTGGPSSLSTLLCPLFIQMMGGKVLKLGVPGRPAGGIDVLSQIKGYKVTPSLSEIERWISKCGYVHFLANKTFAPLDALLFDLRKHSNALNITGLVIASLLAKKIAVGVSNVGLDIRVSSFGNFGTTNAEARENGARFNRVASSLGIKSRCFITNGEIPQQPYIGRGESILALNRIFNNVHEHQLASHLSLCFRMDHSISEKDVEETPIYKLKELFSKNLEVQGGDIEQFNKLSEEIEEKNAYIIRSTQSGMLSIDLLRIRDAITNIQNRIGHVQFPDPCGLILKTTFSQYIDRGSMICSFRCVDKYRLEFESLLNNAFSVSDDVKPLYEFEIIE